MLTPERNSAFRVFSACTFIIAVGMALPLNVHAQETMAPSSTPADNSAMNQRDRSTQQTTADQAGQEAPDRQLMQQIRKSVVSDKSLSTYAQNIKIIASQGKVTLKGPVRSDAEKQTVLSKAANVAGKDNVVDQISVQQSN